MRGLTLFCTLALVLVFAASAYAEVQNVKVTGEVTVRGIYRDTYDLDDSDGNTSGSANSDGITTSLGGTEVSSTGSSESDNFFTSQIRLRVDSDLTDNVAAQIEFANQRDWDDTDLGSSDTTEFDIGVNLANVTLKELFYSPLTVTVGRQDLWLGDGFVIGTKLRDPEAEFSADEFTLYNNFDAIRATLDFDPLTVDLIYSKLDEGPAPRHNAVTDEDDMDLYVVNVGYDFADYSAEAEAYYIQLNDRAGSIDSATTGLNGTGQADKIQTLGARGSIEPFEPLMLRSEIAGQWGDLGSTDRDRRAWALDLRGEYELAEVIWNPTLGAEYVYFSGEDNGAGDDHTGGTGDYGAWNSLFRGHFYSAIREFQGIFYSTDEPNDSNGATNEHQLIADIELHPVDDITLSARYLHFIFDEEPVDGRDEAAGDEVDVQLVYDYTEDVTLSLITAWFFPGDFYAGGTLAESSTGTRSSETAVEVVGSLSLAF